MIHDAQEVRLSTTYLKENVCKLQTFLNFLAQENADTTNIDQISQNRNSEIFIEGMYSFYYQIQRL